MGCLSIHLSVLSAMGHFRVHLAGFYLINLSNLRGFWKFPKYFSITEGRRICSILYRTRSLHSCWTSTGYLAVSLSICKILVINRLHDLQGARDILDAFFVVLPKLESGQKRAAKMKILLQCVPGGSEFQFILAWSYFALNTSQLCVP